MVTDAPTREELLDSAAAASIEADRHAGEARTDDYATTALCHELRALRLTLHAAIAPRADDAIRAALDNRDDIPF